MKFLLQSMQHQNHSPVFTKCTFITRNQQETNISQVLVFRESTGEQEHQLNFSNCTQQQTGQLFWDLPRTSRHQLLTPYVQFVSILTRILSTIKRNWTHDWENFVDPWKENISLLLSKNVRQLWRVHWHEPSLRVFSENGKVFFGRCSRNTGQFEQVSEEHYSGT